MSRSLIISFSSASKKYSRLKKQIQKSIHRGEFWRFTKRKRNHLIHKIERLKQRLTELRTQIRFAAAGAAAGLILMAGQATAQAPVSTNPIGPFVFAPLKNPFPAPAFDVLDYPTMAFADLDGDGDLDAVQSSEQHYLRYFVNQGTKERPYFPVNQPSYDIFSEVFLSGTYQDKTRPAFVDIDDDGDLDMLVGQDYIDNTYGNEEPLHFYRNDAGPDATAHFVAPQEHDPFDEIATYGRAWPIFADVDKDGDQDFLLVGDYISPFTEQHEWVQYFRNDKNSNTFDVDPTYTQLTGNNNPFFIDGEASEIYVAPGFADMDRDGDLDFVYALDDGTIHYRRNDNGTFIEQEGQWVFNDANPGASTGNPFSSIPFIGFDEYRGLSFADFDNDGDTDLVVGVNFESNYSHATSSYVYVENQGKGKMVLVYDIHNPIIGVDFGSESSMSTIDYDNDGDLDMIVSGTDFSGNNENSQPHVGRTVLTNENGVFSAPLIALQPFPGVDADDGNLIPVDLDVDGDLDIALVSNYAFQTPLYFRNESNEYLPLEGEDNPFDFIEDIFRVDMAFGDLDGDGIPDLILAEAHNRLRAYKNTLTGGRPTFTFMTEWSTGFASALYSTNHPTLVDLDNDSDLDIVVGKYDNIWYYENIGSNTAPNFKQYVDDTYNFPDFPDHTTNPFTAINGTDGTASPSFLDIDGDGDKDMLFGDSEGHFTYYENQNPAPVVAKSNTALVWSPGHPIVLDPTMTLTDADSDKIQKITVRIDPFDGTQEKLQLGGTTPPGLSWIFDSENGILTIEGAGSISAYQDALRQIEYVYTGVQPEAGQRKGAGTLANARSFSKTITAVTLDSDLTMGSGNTSVFTITHANDAPTLTPGTFNVTYNNAPIALALTATVGDADDAVLSSAEVSFGSGSYVAAQDRLSGAASGSITVTFDAAAGVLRFTGSGTLAEYQNALRSVTYNNLLGAAATGAARTLSVKVNDGENDSNTATITLNVTTAVVNTPPTITGTANSFWVSGDVVINNNIVLTDATDTTFVGAIVTIQTGAVLSEDELVFTNQKGIIGTYSNTAGQLLLQGTSSVANYQAALRTVRYRNKSTTPTTTDRGITFSISDGKVSTQLTGSVIAINKPPAINPGAPKQTYAEGNVALSVTTILSDPDNNLDLTTLVVSSQQGASVKIENGIVTVDYSAVPKFQGNDVLTITVCDTGGRCSTTTLAVEVGADVKVFTGLSPNGDGVNDWFHMDFLPPNTEVAIYNRWGEAIFETNNYDVTDPNKRFEGKNKNGTEVIAGSYFYKLKFADPNRKVLTGYLLLNR